MRPAAVRVGVRNLKNHLTSYLKLAKNDQEVIVTERGKPIAVIQPVQAASVLKSLEGRIAALAARGEISAPKCGLVRRIRRVRAAGRPISEAIIADRR